MNAVTEEDFLQWASARGMGLDPNYPAAHALTFRVDAEWRFWTLPRESGCRPYFLASLIDLMGEWQACYVWRNRGSWPDRERVADLGDNVNDLVEHLILKGLGLPLGTGAVVEFAREERVALITLLFVTSALDLSPNENAYIVPDHARHILRYDELGVVWVWFADRPEMDRWITAMSAEGFDLPDTVPIAMRRPAWMADGGR